jgi:hypothetical protein
VTEASPTTNVCTYLFFLLLRLCRACSKDLDACVANVLLTHVLLMFQILTLFISKIHSRKNNASALSRPSSHPVFRSLKFVGLEYKFVLKDSNKFVIEMYICLPLSESESEQERDGWREEEREREGERL